MTLTREVPRTGPPTPGGVRLGAAALGFSLVLLALAFLPFCGVAR